MNQLSKNQTDLFIQMINQGIDSWVKAGEIAAEMIDQDPDWPSEVATKCPWLSEARIYDFQRIGLKKVHPRLLLASKPGVVALRRMPYALQEKHSTDPVELLVSNGETLRVDVHNLTADQAAQVFNGDSIRTLSAQRAWLEDRAQKKAAPIAIVHEPFAIVKGALRISEPCTLDRKTLAKLLAEMS